MLEILKTIILDFLDFSLDTGVPRRTNIRHVAGKAAVCIGVRRSGKSTFLFQIMERLMAEGVPRENILYVNFFDDRLHGLDRTNIGLVSEAYYTLYPEKKNSETVYCFFDEIQAVPGWELFVERLMRTEKCEVYLTGSSARMLSKEIATQMRGRALTWEMFPFSFVEFMDWKGLGSEEPFSTRKRLAVTKAFADYWESGGFPEVVGLDRNLRIKTHQEYFQTILFRDLVERHDISHPKALSDLAHRLLDSTGSMYSVSRLAGYLKSLGHKVPRQTVSEYIAWFEDAYFLFTVQLFDPSQARRSMNPKKIYSIDHAFVRSVASGILVNSGHLLENLVFAALRRTYSEIYYYKTSSGKEVDFILPLSGRKKLLVQVCESIARVQTREREVAALVEAMTETRTTTTLLVTRSEDDRIETGLGVIRVVPAWRFLLDASSMVLPGA